MKPEDRTRLLMQALGWQGGTIHQACKETGLEVTSFLHDDLRDDGYGLNSDFTAGWFAIRTCSKDKFKELASRNHGNLQWWFGVCAGLNVEGK